MKSVIFLDIDGVLNTTKSRQEISCKFHHVLINLNRDLVKSDLDLIDELMQLIIKLIHETNSNVVISSMWRFGAKLEWFKQLFCLYGYDIDISRLDTLRTCACEDAALNSDRSKFIEEYLSDKDYESFVMIDDTSKHYDRMLDNLIITDPAVGFTQTDYEQALQILKR